MMNSLAPANNVGGGEPQRLPVVAARVRVGAGAELPARAAAGRAPAPRLQPPPDGPPRPAAPPAARLQGDSAQPLTVSQDPPTGPSTLVKSTAMRKYLTQT